jgi:LmbE family N-acetylglucosaminyl deacetylase
LSPALPRQLVVSTHFDDAALSLAHVLQREGERATVVTICAGPPPGEAPVSEWDSLSGFASGREAARMRALEDRRACALTGARLVHLRHRDGPYRAGPLRAPLMCGAIERLLGGEDILWLPAAIGGHPDHIGVRAALLPLAALLPPGRVRVYADLPYAALHSYRLPRAVSSALPGLRARDVRLRGVAFERKLAAVRCHASQIAPLSAGAPGLLEPHGILARERVWAHARSWQIGKQASSCRK